MSKIFEFYKRNKKIINIVVIVLAMVLLVLPIIVHCFEDVRRNEEYIDGNDVAKYIIKYHELPKNYMTKCTYYTFVKNKKHPERYDKYVTDKTVLGGDTFVERERIENSETRIKLPKEVSLKECDIKIDEYVLNKDNEKEKRFCTRFVYTTNTNKPRVFFTENHYKNFEELTEFSLYIGSNVCWIIFGIYAAVVVSLGVVLYLYNRKNTSLDEIESKELRES